MTGPLAGLAVGHAVAVQRDVLEVGVGAHAAHDDSGGPATAQAHRYRLLVALGRALALVALAALVVSRTSVSSAGSSVSVSGVFGLSGVSIMGLSSVGWRASSP